MDTKTKLPQHRSLFPVLLYASDTAVPSRPASRTQARDGAASLLWSGTDELSADRSHLNGGWIRLRHGVTAQRCP